MAPEKVSPEAETGKEIVFGYDKDSRPVLYMASLSSVLLRSPANSDSSTAPLPSEHRDWCASPPLPSTLTLIRLPNRSSPDRFCRLVPRGKLAHTLSCSVKLTSHIFRRTSLPSLRLTQRTIDLAPATDPPTEMICLCIDFGASLNHKAPPTSLGQAKRVLDILQTYYCERLGRAICVDIPSFFFTFYKVSDELIRVHRQSADPFALSWSDHSSTLAQWRRFDFWRSLTPRHSSLLLSFRRCSAARLTSTTYGLLICLLETIELISSTFTGPLDLLHGSAQALHGAQGS